MKKSFFINIFALAFILIVSTLLVLPNSASAANVWAKQLGSGSDNWNGIAASSDGMKLVSYVMNGYIYTSADGGVTWTQKTSLGKKSWSGVASSADGTKLAVLSQYDYIYTSIDSGATWTRQTGIGLHGFNSIASSADGSKLVVAGGNGIWDGNDYTGDYIYFSTNSGVTWTQESTLSKRYWSAISMTSDGTKLVASDYNPSTYKGDIYTSSNGGASWTKQTTPTPEGWSSFAMSADGSKIAAVGGSYFYLSTNSGVTWTKPTNINNLISNGPTTFVSLSADGTKLVLAHSNGDLYISTDGGTNWVAQTAITGIGWNGITATTDGSKIFAIDGDGYIYTYTGVTAPETDSDNISFNSNNSITFKGYVNTISSVRGIQYGLDTNYGSSIFLTGTSDLGFFLATTTKPLKNNVVYHYRVYATNSAGTTYGSDKTFIIKPLQQTSSGQHIWKSISSSADGTKLAAAGDNDYIYTSINSGATWTVQTNSGIRNWREIVSSADGTKLAAVTSNYDYIYVSTNSGVTWTQQATSFGTMNWISLDMSSDGTKMVAMDDHDVYTSINSGTTWLLKYVNPYNGYFHTVTSSADGVKLAVIDDYMVHTSIDSGATWTEQENSSQTSSNWGNITSSADGTKLFAASNGGYIYTSIDSGVNWTAQVSSGIRVWRGISSSADGTVLSAIDDSGYIYASYDGGVTWTQQVGANLLSWASIVLSSDGDKLAVSGNDTYIYTYSSEAINAPVVFTGEADSAGQTTVTLNGEVIDNGGADITARGFEYGLTSNYTATTTETGIFGADSFNASLTSLTCNAIYHYRAYAVNSVDTSYGDDQLFTTGQCPSVTSDDATNISYTEATLNGTVNNIIDYSVSTRGFEYGLTSDYTATTTETGTFGAESFQSILAPLTCGTTYHYRAYANITSMQVAGSMQPADELNVIYGDDKTFVTAACQITSDDATNISETGATLNGTVNDVGGYSFSVRGFEYGLTSNYTATTTETGTFGAESFQSILTPLTCGTTYHYRAYADLRSPVTDAPAGRGFIYGADKTFVTTACPAAPVIVSSGGGSSAPVSLPKSIGTGRTEVTVPMSETSNIGSINNDGVNILGYINSKIVFNIPQITDTHSITISNLDLVNNIITLTIASTPQTITLKKGETKTVSLTGDNKNNIQLTFANVYINRAEVTARTTTAGVTPSTPVVITTPTTPVVISTPAKPITKPTTKPFTFNKDLKLNSASADVKELQKLLNAKGYVIAKTGAGSKGKETTNFGPATKAALIKFQKANKITPASGLFGPMTRKVVNSSK